MKAVILAGGLGTRLSEETDRIPKPMVQVGSMPVLWHIMKIYAAHGVNDFVVCCGYKGYVIKEFFANYFVHTADVTFDMANNDMAVHHAHAEDWRVSVVDTGDSTMTGGRLRRVREYLGEDADFCFTYGDGLADLNITELISFHRSHGAAATLTAVRPPSRFGLLELGSDDSIRSFNEKPAESGSWVNGGFFVLSPSVIDLIDGDDAVWEREPLERLAASGELFAFKHDGFWQPMDTLWEKRRLEEMWVSGNAPWKVW